MIFNIIDGRKRRFRWLNITAIIEPTEHDNTVEDSDLCPVQVRPGTDIGFDELEDTSLQGAINWALERPYGVTLYLYDLGDGIKATKTMRPNKP